MENQAFFSVEKTLLSRAQDVSGSSSLYVSPGVTWGEKRTVFFYIKISVVDTKVHTEEGEN